MTIDNISSVLNEYGILKSLSFCIVRVAEAQIKYCIAATKADHLTWPIGRLAHLCASYHLTSRRVSLQLRQYSSHRFRYPYNPATAHSCLFVPSFLKARQNIRAKDTLSTGIDIDEKFKASEMLKAYRRIKSGLRP